MASPESIMEPRTDSSASRLWGGTRSVRGCRLTSSAVLAIISSPTEAGRYRKVQGGTQKEVRWMAVGNRAESGRDQRERRPEVVEGVLRGSPSDGRDRD